MAKIFDIRGMLVRKILKDYLAAAQKNNIPSDELADSFTDLLSLAQAETGPMSERVRENRILDVRNSASQWIDALPDEDNLKSYTVVIEERATYQTHVYAHNSDEAEIVAHARHKSGESAVMKVTSDIALTSVDDL